MIFDLSFVGLKTLGLFLNLVGKNEIFLNYFLKIVLNILYDMVRGISFITIPSIYVCFVSFMCIAICIIGIKLLLGLERIRLCMRNLCAFPIMINNITLFIY